MEILTILLIAATGVITLSVLMLIINLVKIAAVKNNAIIAAPSASLSPSAETTQIPTESELEYPFLTLTRNDVIEHITTIYF